MSRFDESLGPVTDVEGWIRYRDRRFNQNEPEGFPFVLIFQGLVVAGIGLVLLAVPGQATAGVQIIPVGLAMALVGDRLLKRVRRTAIRVEPNGVRVRNMFRTRFIPWRRIAGFTFRQEARIALMDGGVVTATGIRGAKQGPGITALLDQLNSTLERQTGWRAVAEPPGSPLSELWKALVSFRTSGSPRPPSL